MKSRIWKKQMAALCGLCLLGLISSGRAARVADIVQVYGIRGNPLFGTGLVVGLNGTGDGSLPSAQMLTSLLQREGQISLSPETLRSGNIALVMVTAELGPWDREGALIDIHISALGAAQSLQGGTLLATELKGLDGEVYAVARVASVSTSSWTVEGKTGSRVTKNHPTVGRIPNGAYVERAETSRFVQIIGGRRYITLSLRHHNFTTAERIRAAIDRLYPDCAFAEDPGTVRVRIPDNIADSEIMKFTDSLLQLEVEVDLPGIVVINERTGTIVVGGTVSISETAVAQGDLVVKIKEQQYVSQPTTPFTDSATTAVVDDTALSIEEREGHLISLPRTVTVEELARALNAIGASPRDLISIFDALNRAGALQAKLEMM
ncbi:MAG TPA: flagellar basal body P-ring protein FlgI [Anaerohalosphaeraceae bacterium]|nr:flagellar basal body P-ring protein FlgI [Anaerohalosphaeraceae bacterium]